MSASSSSQRSTENKSMGAAPRIALDEDLIDFSWLCELAARLPRFPEVPDQATTDAQLLEREKWLRKAQFPPCRIASEDELEDYIDDVARIIMKQRVTPMLFVELWETACSKELAKVVASVETDCGYEAIVSAVAQNLFPYSEYVFQLEDELFRGARQTSVLATRQWLEERSARYMRLCRRWKHNMSISTTRLRNTYYISLPKNIECKVRREKPNTLSQLYNAACACEGEAKRKGKIGKAHPAFPAALEEVSDDDTEIRELDIDDSMQQSQQSSNTSRRMPCKGCGSKEHPYTQCDRKTWRCHTCHKIGHIRKVCPNKVVADAKGKVKVCVEPKPGSANVTTYLDRTQQEKTQTAEAFLQEIRDLLLKRREKAAQKREQKRIKEGKPAPTKISHPVGACCPETKVNQESSQVHNLLVEAQKVLEESDSSLSS